jgi:predicted phage terminase large subunit-like protein
MPARPVVTLELARAVVAVNRLRIQQIRSLDPWSNTARNEGWSGTYKGMPIWKSQLPPPGEWKTWLIMAGRGWGKTRTSAEFVRHVVMSGEAESIYLAGPTIDAVRDVMVEGESGLIAVCERYGFGAHYDRGRRQVTFSNGAKARMFSAEKPRQGRGPNFDLGWADEPASWKMFAPVRGERQADLWDNLQFGLRLRGPKGGQPRQVVSGTPAPVGLMNRLLKLASLVITRGSSYENFANLAESFIEDTIKPYEGTRLGRQEIEGELLEDVIGALWTYGFIDSGRIQIGGPEELKDLLRKMKRMVLGIDPATTFGEESDFTSMTVAGIDHQMEPYVFDHWDGQVSPETWGRKAVELYDQWELNDIHAESNQGGEMVRSVILNAARNMKERRSPIPKVNLVHVHRGKEIRAEPVALMYEQGRAHHVGTFRKLEDQMVVFPVDESAGDDRVDSLTTAISPLIAKPGQTAISVRRGSSR